MRRLLLPAVLLLASLPFLGSRRLWERDRAVQLCVDGAELEALFPADRYAALVRLSEAGVRSVGVAAGPGERTADVLARWEPFLPEGMSVALRPVFRKFSEGGAPFRAVDLLDSSPRIRFLLPAGPALPPPGPGLLEELMDGSSWLFPWAEFSRAPVLSDLARSFPRRLLRAHSIDEEELLRLGPAVASSRFRRAVRERGARFLYVRFFPSLSPEENLAAVESLCAGLRRDGFIPGEARPRWMTAFPRNERTSVPLDPSPTSGGRRWPEGPDEGGLEGFQPAPSSSPLTPTLSHPRVGEGVPPFTVVRQLLAFLLASLGPWWALRTGLRWEGSSWARPPLVAAVSLSVGLAAAAILSSGEFLLGIALVRGVKAAYVIPLLLGAAELYRLRGLKEAWVKPLTFGGAALAGAAILAAGLYVLRSGHGPEWGAPSWELRVREGLESLLSVRPRFKEFAVGYPLLWLAADAGRSPSSREAGLSRLLWLGGLSAPVSVINTFCHAHVPLGVSLLRTLHGFWLGAVLGLVLVAVRRGLAPLLFPGPSSRRAKAPAVPVS